ncbi:MAG: sigma-54-dependent Fis family transcriptional regulator [Xanthomonadaceae bacterium]|nr:sigma-54-dependent Fis family transcriptional regulator [Xanthomonadaceae bacterium]
MEIKTTDHRLMELIQLAKTVAQSKATILIQGESGTGKELMAKLIHESSTRNAKPFIAINCAAIPENLLESELFGYEKGAFTGAMNAKAGKFELAHGGTLLLDEISEMDIRLQAKLLRVIQEGEVDRIGGRKPIAVDVRIIATTNQKLADVVKADQFREDLYFRLNVVNLTIPALRDRGGDVEALAKQFGKDFADKNGKVFQGFSESAIRIIQGYSWPGNVRELENVIERAVITSQAGIISDRDIVIDRPSFHNLSDKMEMLSSSQAGWNPGQTLDKIEKSVILDALKYHNGNRTHTAKALGISIRTLRNKLADYRRDGLKV